LPQDQTNRNRLKRGIQSALADSDIATDQRGSQAECDPRWRHSAFLSRLTASFCFSCLNFPIRMGALRSSHSARLRQEI
jgi:hypothetical protein